MIKRLVLAVAIATAIPAAARAQELHGDLAGFMPSPTVAKVNGATPGGSCPSHQWANTLSSSAVPSCAQPTTADIGGSVGGDLSGGLPNPTVAKVNGATPGGSCPTHQWANTLSTSAVPSCAQPTAADISGLGSLATQSSVAGALIGIQVFTASGTYTPDGGTNSVVVEGCGGGASGGGAAASTATNNAGIASGGGAGGYFRIRLTSGFSAATVTIGAGGAAPTAGNNTGNAGGNTSFGTAVTANGGSGGISMGAGSGRANIGGTGGTVTVSSGTAIAATQGADGGKLFFSSSVGWSGEGGSSPFGKGGQSVVNPNSGSIQSSGNAAQGYCAGGSGALSSDSASGTAESGGAGAAGIVIVWEFS